MCLNRSGSAATRFIQKNKVQLKTEETIEQLNEHNKQLIKEIKEFEWDCTRSYLANQQTNNEFKKTKQALEEFTLTLNDYLKQSIRYQSLSVAQLTERLPADMRCQQF